MEKYSNLQQIREKKAMELKLAAQKRSEELLKRKKQPNKPEPIKQQTEKTHVADKPKKLRILHPAEPNRIVTTDSKTKNIEPLSEINNTQTTDDIKQEPIKRKHPEDMKINDPATKKIQFNPADYKITQAPNLSFNIGVAQYQPSNDIAVNLELCKSFIEESKKQNVELLCLPAYFLTPFNNMESASSIAEPIDGETIKTLCKWAGDYNIWLSLGGFLEKIKNDNNIEDIAVSHVIINASGDIVMRISMPINNTTQYFESPNHNIINNSNENSFEVSGIKFGVSFDNDLLFPSLYQKLKHEDKVHLIIVSNTNMSLTDEQRRTLLSSRALETQTFTVSSNLVNCNILDRQATGSSLVIAPSGSVMCDMRREIGLAKVCINLSLLNEVRSSMKVEPLSSFLYNNSIHSSI